MICKKHNIRYEKNCPQCQLERFLDLDLEPELLEALDHAVALLASYPIVASDNKAQIHSFKELIQKARGLS